MSYHIVWRIFARNGRCLHLVGWDHLDRDEALAHARHLFPGGGYVVRRAILGVC